MRVLLVAVAALVGVGAAACAAPTPSPSHLDSTPVLTTSPFHVDLTQPSTRSPFRLNSTSVVSPSPSRFDVTRKPILPPTLHTSSPDKTPRPMPAPTASSKPTTPTPSQTRTVAPVPTPSRVWNPNSPVITDLSRQVRESKLRCIPPPNAVHGWYRDYPVGGLYICASADYDTAPWALLNAYRTGGLQNQHWIYTDDADHPMCLRNWTYWSNRSDIPFGHIPGTITKVNDPQNKSWCPIRVSRIAMIEDEEYAACTCS